MVNPDNSKLSSLKNPTFLNILGAVAMKIALEMQEEENKSKKGKEIAFYGESRKSESKEDSHEYSPSRNKKKQIKKRKSKSIVHQVREVRSEGREPTPEWLFNYMRNVNGSDPKKIINKRLFKTDLSKTHCRLSIPVKQVVDKDFLREEELSMIEKQGGIKGVLVDEEMKKWDVELRKWDMNSTSTYVLVDGWTKLFQERGYEPNDPIRLWSFRSDGLLHFALVPPTGNAAQANLSPAGGAGECSGPSGEEGKGSSPTDESGQGSSSP